MPNEHARINLYLTPGERDRIEEKAAEYGLTVSGYVRMAALQFKMEVPPVGATGTSGSRVGDRYANHRDKY